MIGSPGACELEVEVGLELEVALAVRLKELVKRIAAMKAGKQAVDLIRLCCFIRASPNRHCANALIFGRTTHFTKQFLGRSVPALAELHILKAADVTFVTRV
jgi:hypothetical protein